MPYVKSQIPTGELGSCSIERFKLNKSGPEPGGWYTKLMQNGQRWIDDTFYTYKQHQTLFPLLKDNQTILITGLGMGWLIELIHTFVQPKKIVIIEKSLDVVELVWNYISQSHLQLIVGDALEIKSTEKFDLAVHDIWIPAEQHQEFKRLKTNFPAEISWEWTGQCQQ